MIEYAPTLNDDNSANSGPKNDADGAKRKPEGRKFMFRYRESNPALSGAVRCLNVIESGVC